MNDPATTLLAGAVRASIVLAPAALLHALASRRGPAAGAWVAALALGLTVPLAVGMPGLGRGAREQPAAVATSRPGLAGPRPTTGVAPSSTARGWDLDDLRSAWERLGRRAVAPARRLGRWSGAGAIALLAAIGLGLARLVVDLAAIGLARRRGRPVHDAGLVVELEHLRISMGCRRPVALVEAPDLGSPATAGWRRPVIFLPEGWRSWDEAERRAVLAHELAHVCRGDFASGLVARVATALHVYHPLAHWLASRLRLQQELAADALGARYAGGRRAYLHALSRLALRQEGRPPSRPARAFLPARGTLIRRIDMLRDDDATERPWSRGRRLVLAAVLVGVASGALALRMPARGGEPDEAARPAQATAGGGAFDLSYVPEDAMGFVAVRPAALFRRAGMARFAALADMALKEELAMFARVMKLPAAGADARPIRVEEIEQFTCGLGARPIDPKKVVKGGPTHQLIFSGGMLRMTAPFDWVAQLRAWKLEPRAVREGGRTYYRIKNLLGDDAIVYCPDDRTIVFDQDDRLLRLIRRGSPRAPAYVGGAGWERVRDGLVLYALDNRGGRWTRELKGSRAEEVGLAAAFERAERWAIGLADSDDFDLRAVGTCADDDATAATERATREFLAIGRKLAAEAGRPGPKSDEDLRRLRGVVDGLRVARDGRAVVVQSTGLGTLADLVSGLLGPLAK